MIASDHGILGSGPGMTNNVAEYTAAIKAVEKAKSLGFRRLDIRGDSQLAIKQMNGVFAVRSPRIVPLYRRLCQLVQGLNVTFDWVPREQNEEADQLSKKAFREIAEASRRQRATEIGNDKITKISDIAFEVVGSKGDIYSVDLKSETCTCRDFDRHKHDRIPIRCKHLLACLRKED